MRYPATAVRPSRTPQGMAIHAAVVPVLLDVAGFTAITVGVWLLAGEWAWIVAGGLLILAAYPPSHRVASVIIHG